MATCLATVSRALRLARIVALGDEAQDAELDDGMMVLRSIYQRLADTALAANEEVYETASYTAGENERIYCLGTVTLPELVDEGTIRRVKDLAAVQLNNNGAGWQSWISDKGDWVRVDNLVAADEAPLSDRNEDGLACLVAMEYAGTFGSLAEIDPVTVQKAKRFQSQLQPRDHTPVEYY